jgi:hypothetical protein
MPLMAAHIGHVNDGTEPEERQEKYLDVSTAGGNNSKKSQEESESFKFGTDNPWPEYLVGSGGGNKSRAGMCVWWFRNVCTSWSFSYMNPILRKGKRQFQDGHHLTLEDLYDVPDDMRSEYLVQRFWYVSITKKDLGIFGLKRWSIR